MTPSPWGLELWVCICFEYVYQNYSAWVERHYHKPGNTREIWLLAGDMMGKAKLMEWVIRMEWIIQHRNSIASALVNIPWEEGKRDN